MPELTLDMKRLSTQMLRCALAIRVHLGSISPRGKSDRQTESQSANENQRHFQNGVPADVFDLPPWWREDFVSPGSLDGTCLCGGYSFQQETS